VPCVEYKYYDQEECPTYCKYITTGSDSFGNEEGACLEKGKQRTRTWLSAPHRTAHGWPVPVWLRQPRMHQMNGQPAAAQR